MTAERSPHVDYMAKDYASFRMFMLEQIGHTLPDWQERHAADVGVALVEVLAYAADLLSYHQDAVAMEAYLDTAVSRVSVARHARLLGYRVHGGCNARTLVHFDGGGVVVPPGTPLRTRILGQEAVVPEADDTDWTVHEQGPVFETMHPLTVLAAHNSIGVARASSTSALLDGAYPDLGPGDFLAFVDADPDRRRRVALHPVRLCASTVVLDGGGQATEVSWHDEDALASPNVRRYAIGNIVLADHGRTVRARLANVGEQRYRPRLASGPLTSRAPFNCEDASAWSALQQDPRNALPAVRVSTSEGEWFPRADLLGGGRFDRSFVVETDSDGTSTLRFGDGVHGRSPRFGDEVNVVYRVGNGTSGNISAHEIGHLVYEVSVRSVARVSNIIAAAGGVEHETIAAVKLLAPTAARRTSGRCIVADDYAAVAREVSGVASASATLNVPVGGGLTRIEVSVWPVDHQDSSLVCAAVARSLGPRTAIGHRVEVLPSKVLPVHVAVRIVTELGRQVNSVAAAIKDELGLGDPDTMLGLFGNRGLGVGKSLRVTDLLQAIQRVTGVRDVTVATLCPAGKEPGQVATTITPEPLEIIRPVDVAGLPGLDIDVRTGT